MPTAARRCAARCARRLRIFSSTSDLGFEPDGAGEHVFVHIEKRGANTDWVARELAKFAGVAPMNVSYSGIKDRHAVTRQTFSVHLPGKAEPDWNALRLRRIAALLSARGTAESSSAARTNAMCSASYLRDVSGDRRARTTPSSATSPRTAFRIISANSASDAMRRTSNARIAMFAGKRVQRHERSMLLSAARSASVQSRARRTRARGNWNRPLDGDVWMLARNAQHFRAGADHATNSRDDARGRHPSDRTVVGRGRPAQRRDVATIERRSRRRRIRRSPDGLAAAGLRQERRSLVLMPEILRRNGSPTTSLESASG